MAQLDPRNIIKGGQYGRKRQEVFAMLERYGFHPTRSGKHLIFNHPIHNLTKPVSLGSGDLDAGLVYGIAKDCLRAEKLDAKTNDGELGELPQWLTKAIDPKFIQNADPHVMIIRHEANGSVARSYTIRHYGNALRVQSNEFEDLEIEVPFATEQKPIQAFQRLFAQLDREVCDATPVLHVEQPTSSFTDLIEAEQRPVRVYREPKIATTGPRAVSASEMRRERQDKTKQMVRTALALPITGLPLGELLEPADFIYPAVDRLEVAQPTLKKLQSFTTEIKNLLASIIKDPLDMGANKRFKELLTNYANLMQLLPKIREEDAGNLSYGYVADPAKCKAAATLEVAADDIVSRIHALKRIGPDSVGNERF